jgi:hypothetical protein
LVAGLEPFVQIFSACRKDGHDELLLS